MLHGSRAALGSAGNILVIVFFNMVTGILTYFASSVARSALININGNNDSCFTK